MSNDEAILENYLDRMVRIHFAPGMVGPGFSPCVEGKFHDYHRDGILVEEKDGSLAYIPLSAIRMVQIKPRAGLWERLTGSG